MTPGREAVPVALIARLYRTLLLAYPRRFRQEYGLHVLQVFTDRCRDAYEQGGLAALIGVWPHGVGDLIWTALAEWRIVWKEPLLDEERRYKALAGRYLLWGGCWPMLGVAIALAGAGQSLTLGHIEEGLLVVLAGLIPLVPLLMPLVLLRSGLIRGARLASLMVGICYGLWGLLSSAAMLGLDGEGGTWNALPWGLSFLLTASCLLRARSRLRGHLIVLWQRGESGPPPLGISWSEGDDFINPVWRSVLEGSRSPDAVKQIRAVKTPR
jgi:hypothetical protein